MAGWGTGIEGLYLDHEGYRFEPDLVLVGFFIGNDLHDNYYKLQLDGDDLDLAVKPYFGLGKDGVVVQRDPPPPPPPPSGLLPALRSLLPALERDRDRRPQPLRGRAGEHPALGRRADGRPRPAPCTTPSRPASSRMAGRSRASCSGG